MNELSRLVERAKSGDPVAFAELVQRYHDWAIGWAVGLLGDYQLAQDAVQESFAAAHASLPTLAQPEAFPGWLKAIVRHTCFRVLRQHGLDLVSLAAASDVASAQPEPEWVAEDDERRHEVLSALAVLPEEQRQVVLLHYWREYSHREIATLLGIPATQVNNRLHAARLKLREELQAMTENTTWVTPPASPIATGTVIAVAGPVVDVRFAHHRLPPLRSWLVPSASSGARKPVLAVVQYLIDGVARTVVVSTGAALKPGFEVVEASAGAAEPISDSNARKATAQIARLAHQAGQSGARIETGIKAIDLFCPLLDGDVVGLAARPSVGQMVLLQELLYRRGTRPGRLTLVAPIPVEDPVYAPGDNYGIGDVQVVYLPVRDMATPPAGFLDPVDATIALSLPLARLGIWPAVDPNASTSKHLDPAVVGAEHVEIATRARDLLRRYPPEQESETSQKSLSAEDRNLVARARRLRRFLTQPLYVAVPWSRGPAAIVPTADTLRGCRGILDGAYDELPEEAFYLVNTIDEVIQCAGARRS